MISNRLSTIELALFNIKFHVEIRMMLYDEIRLKLADYEYEIVYKARNINKNADASRSQLIFPSLLLEKQMHLSFVGNFK